MAERPSGYERQPNDTYVTPGWVWGALHDSEGFRDAWDCCPLDASYDFLDTDIEASTFSPFRADIATNPPFNKSEAIVRHALELTHKWGARCAFLLPNEWDTAKGRVDLFRAKPFKKKLVLTKRIRWLNLDQKANGPSKNHAWYVWDWQYSGLPQLDYWVGD